jgi:hypothetical protein
MPRPWFLLPIMLSACTRADPGPACTPDPASIQDRILTPSCALSGCHSANDSAGRLSLARENDPLAQMVNAPASGCSGRVLVVPGAPERSLLYEKLTASPPSCGAHMPVASDLPAAQKECVRAWIAALPAPPPPLEPFSCFQWIHLDAWSDDCYRSPETCEQERKSMEQGARPTQPCKPAKIAWCTDLRPDTDRTERCFADERACARYRAMITGRKIPSTACEKR